MRGTGPVSELAALIRIRTRHQDWQLGWCDTEPGGYWTAERRPTQTSTHFIAGHSLTELAGRLDHAERQEHQQ